MTYIAFTSPCAEAPPPSRGDLSVHSSGVCNAKTFPERKSGLGTRRFVSAYYPRHTPQSPPSRGVVLQHRGMYIPGTIPAFVSFVESKDKEPSGDYDAARCDLGVFIYS